MFTAATPQGKGHPMPAQSDIQDSARRAEDEKDAKAFRVDGFNTLIDAVDAVDAMAPPVFHAATKRGPRRGRPLCGAVGFTRDGTYAVTCEACKRRRAR